MASSHSDLDHPMNILLTPDQVAERYSVKRNTVERWCAAGRFPAPIKISGTSPRWRLVDLQDYESALSNENRGGK